MITDDQDPEMEIRAFFEHDLELTVTRITVSVLRSADFLVDGDGAGYVLEVKARSDDKESIAALRAGGVVAGAESLGWARWASDGVRSARQQFASSNPTGCGSFVRPDHSERSGTDQRILVGQRPKP